MVGIMIKNQTSYVFNLGFAQICFVSIIQSKHLKKNEQK